MPFVFYEVCGVALNLEIRSEEKKGQDGKVGKVRLLKNGQLLFPNGFFDKGKVSLFGRAGTFTETGVGTFLFQQLLRSIRIGNDPEQAEHSNQSDDEG